MKEVFICDCIRTPIGRFGGALSSVRPDDLAAIPLHCLAERNPTLDLAAIDDVIMGCAGLRAPFREGRSVTAGLT